MSFVLTYFQYSRLIKVSIFNCLYPELRNHEFVFSYIFCPFLLSVPTLATIVKTYFEETTSDSILLSDVLVVGLLFYVHGKHLRSCRDGQLT